MSRSTSRFLMWAQGSLILALISVLTSACAGHVVLDPKDYNVYLKAPAEARARYVIQSGDQLEIRFFYQPEQNVILPVRPDGFISLPLANDVRAAGLTPEELRVAITAACERSLKSPEVAVIVRSFTGYKVHVGGHVTSPGVFELNGQRNVLQAIFEAGGFLPTASPEDVLVIRPEGKGNLAIIPIDIEAVLEGRETEQNIELRPFDVVYVPASPIANINKWVEQYIRNNLPFNVGWAFSP